MRYEESISIANNHGITLNLASENGFFDENAVNLIRLEVRKLSCTKYAERNREGISIIFYPQTRPAPLEYAANSTLVQDSRLGNRLQTMVFRYAVEKVQNRMLMRCINEGGLKTCGYLDPKNQPPNLFTRALLKEIEAHPLVTKSLNPQDLKHQTAFFLTTLPLTELVENSSSLTIDVLGGYREEEPIFNKRLLAKVIREQNKVVRHYVKSLTENFRSLISPYGIFTKPGWRLTKNGNTIIATNGSEALSVLLKPVPLDYALEVHEKLHYIHASRADFALGLYLEGETTPFSILGIQRIDRNYKKAALLLRGFQPSACFEFTRLYSHPGTPLNTSSVFLTLAKRYLRENYPDTQAVVTAFMPAYVSGASMICSGFETTLMAKEQVHYFREKEKMFVHCVRRRVAGKADFSSIIPVFPLPWN